MNKWWKVLTLLLGGVLASCTPTGNWEPGVMEATVTPPVGGVSLSQSYWGHRPGPRGFQTVIIDAGHGGHDSGAVGRRVREKDVALDTARRLKRKLQGDFNVVMVRDSDRFIDLNKRVSITNRYKSAVLVSIHYNHSGKRSRGPESYYWRVDSYGLAKRLQREMARVSPSERGSRGLVRRRLRLTRNPRIPCALVEVGYLSNYSDAQLSRRSSYRDKMAEAMARAIRQQAQTGDAGLGSLPRPINAPISRATDPPGR